MIAKLEKYIDRQTRGILDTRHSVLIVDEDIVYIDNILEEYNIKYTDITYDSVWEFIYDVDKI